MTPPTEGNFLLGRRSVPKREGLHNNTAFYLEFLSTDDILSKFTQLS